MKVIGKESTPNPNAVKFNLDIALTDSPSASYANKAAATGNPFIEAIFDLQGVESIFCMQTFVTISKQSSTSWETLAPAVISLLETFDPAQATASTTEPSQTDTGESGDTVFTQVNSLIDEFIRPALASDGGGLEVVSLEDYQVQIRYQGACGT